MHLEGQATRRSTAVSEAGFALAALLVAIAILSVMMLVALPTWRHQVQREKEAELIFRGEQYARAINLYQRKLAGAFPPSLDTLVEQKFLRRKYKDPITGEDFLPVLANSPAALAAMQNMPQAPGGGTAAQAPGPIVNPPGRSGAPGGRGSMSPGAPGVAPGGRAGQPSPGGVAGGIVGVMSKATGPSIRLYNGRDRYDQWIFTSMAASAQAGQMGPGARPGQPIPDTPGAPRPGRIGGVGGVGGSPGTGRGRGGG